MKSFLIKAISLPIEILVYFYDKIYISEKQTKNQNLVGLSNIFFQQIGIVPKDLFSLTQSFRNGASLASHVFLCRSPQDCSLPSLSDSPAFPSWLYLDVGY